MGINTVEYDKIQYQALLETTSFSGHQRVDVERYWKRSLRHLENHIHLME